MSASASSRRSGSSSAVDAFSRPGWLTFATVVMFSVGVLRLISAIYYFADSHRVNDLTLGAFGDNLFLWGIWDLLIAALAFFAGWLLLSNNGFGRAIGYLWAIVVIVQSFTLMNFAPWWGFASMILGVLVIYALASTSEAELPAT
jgi:energy-converting hydrogenase Eha subunit B